MRKSNKYFNELYRAGLDYFKVTENRMNGVYRSYGIAEPRLMLMAAIAWNTDVSLVDIGVRFGGRTGQTVGYARKAVVKKCRANECFKKEYNGLLNHLGVESGRV